MHMVSADHGEDFTFPECDGSPGRVLSRGGMSLACVLTESLDAECRTGLRKTEMD